MASKKNRSNSKRKRARTKRSEARPDVPESKSATTSGCRGNVPHIVLIIVIILVLVLLLLAWKNGWWGTGNGPDMHEGSQALPTTEQVQRVEEQKSDPAMMVFEFDLNRKFYVSISLNNKKYEVQGEGENEYIQKFDETMGIIKSENSECKTFKLINSPTPGIRAYAEKVILKYFPEIKEFPEDGVKPVDKD